MRIARLPWSLAVTLFWIHGVFFGGAAEEDLPPPKPVPLMQALPLPHDQISFQRDGVELTRYHFSPDQNRPFLFPVRGPSGRCLTRMGHPRDPVTHSHHNSVWVSHNDVNGISFWDDRGRGRIVHKQIQRFEDTEAGCLVEVLNEWKATNLVLLTEHRRVMARPLPGAEWLLVLDLELAAADQPIVLGKTPFGLLGVRMAKTIGVHDGGGRIRNSEGAVNEKAVFWKPARWVDYAGPVTRQATEGITLLDHPANPNHPTVFHVRNDGWMGAALTFDGPRRIEPGQPLRLRYGLYVHAGMPDLKAIEARWDQFCSLPGGDDSREMPGDPP